jgi:hypothetical protein
MAAARTIGWPVEKHWVLTHGAALAQPRAQILLQHGKQLASLLFVDGTTEPPPSWACFAKDEPTRAILFYPWAEYEAVCSVLRTGRPLRVELQWNPDEVVSGMASIRGALRPLAA